MKTAEYNKYNIPGTSFGTVKSELVVPTHSCFREPYRQENGHAARHSTNCPPRCVWNVNRQEHIL